MPKNIKENFGFNETIDFEDYEEFLKDLYDMYKDGSGTYDYNIDFYKDLPDLDGSGLPFIPATEPPETVKNSFVISDTVNISAYSIGALINLFNLFILTRKELRTNFIYTIMIGTCICDILYFSMALFLILINIELFYTFSYYCQQQGLPFFHVLATGIAETILAVSQQSSAFLALFMITVRAFTMGFPMNHIIQNFSTPKSAILMILGLFGVFGIWYSMLRVLSGLQKSEWPQKPGFECYILYADYDLLTFYQLVNAFFAFLLTILYIIATFGLVLVLFKVKQRQKNLAGEKSDNASKLVIVMAVSFILSECMAGTGFILEYCFFQYMEQHEYNIYAGNFVAISNTFSVLNSVSHCLICFFMSSQYRATFKQIFGKEKKVNITIVAPASISANSQKFVRPGE